MLDKKNSKDRNSLFAFYLITSILLMLGLIFYSANTGSIRLSALELIRGLFFEYDSRVETVFDLRFPRIFISLFSGAALSISGVLLQCALRNPLADSSILGINAGASFFAALIILFLPEFIFLSPIFAIIGGIATFVLIQILSGGSDSRLRVILIGISISAMFSGLTQGLNYAFSNGNTSPMTMMGGLINMKTWDDFKILIPYVFIGTVIAIILSRRCNLLYLSDKTIRSIGVNSKSLRVLVSILSSILASAATAIVGPVSFLGLIVPHMARTVTGSDHKKLIPFSAVLGANVFLIADTLGRTIVYPAELPASIIMAIVGGPFFIVLLRRSMKNDR